MIVNVSMKLEIQPEKLEAIKAMENHIDWFIDLDEWPEIKQVFDVKVKKEGEKEMKKYEMVKWELFTSEEIEKVENYIMTEIGGVIYMDGSQYIINKPDGDHIIFDSKEELMREAEKFAA